MDALVRGWRPLLIGGGAGLLLVACLGRGASGPAIGESNKAPGGRNPSDGGVVMPIDGAVALPENYRSKFTKVNTKARLVSQGHAAGRWEVDVWANEIAAKALADRTRAVPVGAVVVEEHFERGGDKGRGPVMVMEKRAPGFAKEHGDWRWAVVGSQGQLVKDGFIETCAGCHDDAPMDGLFPIVE